MELADRTNRRRQQQLVVVIVPVVLGLDLLGLEVRLLECVSLEELGDRLDAPAASTQPVRIHMVRVRDRRDQSHVRRAVFERFIDAVGVFERMREVMMRGEVIGR